MSNKNSLEIAYQNATELIHKKEYKQAVIQLNEIIKVFPNELNSIYLLIEYLDCISLLYVFTIIIKLELYFFFQFKWHECKILSNFLLFF